MRELFLNRDGLLWMMLLRRYQQIHAAVEKTVTGTLLHILDALAKPSVEFEVGIEPQQDLHGQDAPYPAGGGVNVLDPNLKYATQTVRGVTLTTTDGYNFTVTGTGESGTGNLQTNNIATQDAVVMPAGTYTVSSGNILSTYHPDGSWYSNRGGTFTSPEDFIVKAVYREIGTGTTYNTSAFLALAKGSTAPTSWSPYSNECPITGWTGVDVTRTGKNYASFPAGAVSQGVTFSNDNGIISTSGISINTAISNSDIFTVEEGDILFLSGCPSGGSGSTYRIDIRDENGVVLFNGTAFDVGEGYELTVPQGITSIKIAVRISTGINTTGMVFKPVICKKDTRTTIPITFPDAAGTVYGCTLTNQGTDEWKLAVDRASVDLGTISWDPHSSLANVFTGNGDVLPTWARIPDGGTASAFCSSYKLTTSATGGVNAIDFSIALGTGYSTRIYVHDSSVSDISEFRTAISGVQLVYELATPITYTLTSQQALTLLKGENNIWVDNSDDLELKYLAKAGTTP